MTVETDQGITISDFYHRKLFDYIETKKKKHGNPIKFSSNITTRILFTYRCEYPLKNHLKDEFNI